MTLCPCSRPLPKFGICDATKHACACGREYTLCGVTVVATEPPWMARVEALEVTERALDLRVAALGAFEGLFDESDWRGFLDHMAKWLAKRGRALKVGAAKEEMMGRRIKLGRAGAPRESVASATQKPAKAAGAAPALSTKGTT